MNRAWCTLCGSGTALTWCTPTLVPTWWLLTPLAPPPCTQKRQAAGLYTRWKFFEESFSVLCEIKGWFECSRLVFPRWCRCSRAAGRRTRLLTSTARPRLPTGTSSPLARISPSFYWERVGAERPPTASISSSTSWPSLAAPTRPSPVGWTDWNAKLETTLWFRLYLWCVAEKWQAVYTVLEAFGNVSTCLNGNASRFSHVVSLDVDQAGLVTSASIQVFIWFFLLFLVILLYLSSIKRYCSVLLLILQTMLLEKTRVTRRPEGEMTFNVFYFLMAGVDSSLRSGSLQLCDIHDKQKLCVWFICWCIAVINWLKFNQRRNGDDGWPCVLVSFSGLSCTSTTLLRTTHSKSCLRQKYKQTLWTLFFNEKKEKQLFRTFFFAILIESMWVWWFAALCSQRNLCALC